ncbi:TPA: hypothetical protein KFR63_003453 [Escherichia coli]|nr:hypothetical protein [Escherichia coli]
MTITDITYGIPAEVWPRDYSNVEFSLQFLRARNIPVRVTIDDGQTFCLYVIGLLTARNKLDLSPVRQVLFAITFVYVHQMSLQKTNVIHR